MELLAIAFRNVMRNRRRSLLNILAITVGITVMINMLGWFRGLTETVYDSVIRIDTGHVQILNGAYQAEKRRQPLDRTVADYPDVMKELAGAVFVEGVSARIDATGEISNGTEGIMVMIRAVTPEGEARVTNISGSIVEGSYFGESGGVIVGKGLAEKLSLSPGSQVFISCLDRYGVRNLVDAEVEGIFSFGYPAMDDNVIYLDIAKAAELLSTGNDATRIVVRLGKGTGVRDGVKAISGMLAGRRELTVYPWQEFAQTVVGSIESRIRIIGAVIGVLFLLIIMGILNSMSMAVEERYREIGTMRAIGMNRRRLVYLFLAEGFWLGAAGSACALVISCLTGWFFLTHGVDVTELIPKEVPIPFTSLLVPVYTVLDVSFGFFSGAAVAVLGSLLPARRAGKMIIRDALGSHV